MKLKRIAAGVLGAIGVLASLPAFMFTAWTFKDAWETFEFTYRLWAWRELSFMGAIGLSMLLPALLASRIGLGLLRFAWTGRNSPITGWMRPLLLGPGFFFPGFVLSLPLTLFLASRARPGEEWDFAALKVSFGIGLATAITSCLVLFRNEWTRRRR